MIYATTRNDKDEKQKMSHDKKNQRIDISR